MKRKKKNSTFLFLLPLSFLSPIIYSHSISSPFFLSLSHIIHSYTHGKEEKHFTIVLVLYLPVKSLDRALGMSDREEKKPMATSSEVLSWYVKNSEIHIPLGPCGKTADGTSWDDGSHERIQSIFVSYTSNWICSIRTVYKDLSDKIFIAPQRGSAGVTFEAIHLPPETPITRIDGTSDKYGITWLELSTKNGKIGSFGIKDGFPFMYQDPRGFTGFHGRSNNVWITALGVYVNSSATKS